jgi:hypothetical protein
MALFAASGLKNQISVRIGQAAAGNLPLYPLCRQACVKPMDWRGRALARLANA